MARKPDAHPRESDPSETAEPFVDYLAAVGSVLPFSEREVDEVAEELASHLGESRDKLIADGWSAPAAEQETLRRLGRPDALARGLVRSRLTSRRLLAAAGGGILDAFGEGFRGLLKGFMYALALTFALIVPTSLLDAIVRSDLSASITYGQPWLVLVIWMSGAYHAARGLASRIDRETAAHRSRGVVAVVGASAICVFALLVPETEWHWALIAGLPLIPVSFMVGAMRAGVSSPLRAQRWFVPVTFGVIALLFAVDAVTGGGRARAMRVAFDPEWGHYPPAAVASWLGVPVRDVQQLTRPEEERTLGTSWTRRSDSLLSVHLSLPDRRPDLLRAWRDFRVELWPVEAGGAALTAMAPIAIADAFSFGRVGPGGTGVLIDDSGRIYRGTEPECCSGGTILEGRVEADVSLAGIRGPMRYWAVMTATDAKGQRRLLTAPFSDHYVFSGTAVEFLGAATPGTPPVQLRSGVRELDPSYSEDVLLTPPPAHGSE